MITKYDKFTVILNLILSGRISSAKKNIKALSRDERYDLILYSRYDEAMMDNNKASEKIIRWCVTGDFK